MIISKNTGFSEGISGISVFVKESVPLDKVKDNILNLDTKGQEILVRTFRFIRDSSIEIFDRTFQIAKVLQVLSIIVAFCRNFKFFNVTPTGKKKGIRNITRKWIIAFTII